MNSDSVGMIDVASQNPLACKAVFVQQRLPKPPRRHGSLNQRLPLRISLAYSSCSRQFNLVRHFLPKHYCCFPRFAKTLIVKVQLSAIHENFHLRKIPAIRYFYCISNLQDDGILLPLRLKRLPRYTQSEKKHLKKSCTVN